MSGILKSDFYGIISLSGKYSPVGVDPTQPAFQFVCLNAPVSQWEVRQVSGNVYRLSVGGYQHTGELDKQVNASIHTDHGQDWYIIYSQHDDAYLITVNPQGSSGWTVNGPNSELKIAGIVATMSDPPQYSRDQLFKFHVEHASNAISANLKWTQGMHQIFPHYFPDPRVKQAPKLLWIGCSDSRVQESDAITALPGNAFVHRNITNQFHYHIESERFSDRNVLSVLSYSLAPLGVQHIVIVGHEHCGGVIRAIDRVFPPPRPDGTTHDCIIRDSIYQPPEFVHDDQLNDLTDETSTVLSGTVDQWLDPLTDRVRQIQGNLPTEPEARLRVVTEENVKMQVNNLAKLDNVIRGHAKRPVLVHGWVYDFANGVIRDLQVTRVLGSSSPSSEEV